MRRIPFTQAVLLSTTEADRIAGNLDIASTALQESADLNVALSKRTVEANRKLDEYARIIVASSEGTQQIMQINLLLSGAIGAIRRRAAEGDDPGEMSEFVEQTCSALEAALSEFDSGTALA